jgi:hypothetical protein
MPSMAALGIAWRLLGKRRKLVVWLQLLVQQQVQVAVVHVEPTLLTEEKHTPNSALGNRLCRHHAAELLHQ